jgi:hypothetical protein
MTAQAWLTVTILLLVFAIAVAALLVGDIAYDWWRHWRRRSR